MMLMTTLANIFWLVWSILDQLKIDTQYFANVSPVVRIMINLNYGLIFRFVRVIVQLKASEENSMKIMAVIHRSKKIECFVYVDLAILVIA